MANKRINELDIKTPLATDWIAIDGSTTGRTQISTLLDSRGLKSFMANVAADNDTTISVNPSFNIREIYINGVLLDTSDWSDDGAGLITFTLPYSLATSDDIKILYY